MLLAYFLIFLPILSADSPFLGLFLRVDHKNGQGGPGWTQIKALMSFSY
jgi:hypothetical protein